MSTEGTEKAFDDQEQYEEVVEIDEHGNVYRPGEAPRSGSARKPTILIRYPDSCATFHRFLLFSLLARARIPLPLHEH
jgi:hypothetical protein